MEDTVTALSVLGIVGVAVLSGKFLMSHLDTRRKVQDAIRRSKRQNQHNAQDALPVVAEKRRAPAFGRR